ncbi:MAG TPA: tetratricopeptide repeat protein [Vicinamibacteria bacterium]|nr:tetratricopeptide repeat protein [Vicinamibacteria bacterium]
MKKRSSKRNAPRRSLRITLIGAATAVAGGAIWWLLAPLANHQPLAPGAFRGRNLLLITLDTLRADHLGSYGSTTGLTPHLDQFASEGVRFAQLQSHAPLTLPSHASIFSAKFLLGGLVRSTPSYAEAHNYLGVAHGRMGRIDEAKREFETVLELDPSSAATYNNLGSLALSQGDSAEALTRFREALRYDENLASAHNDLGVARAREGDFAAAIAAWRRTLNPQQFDALYNLAMTFVERSPAEAVPLAKRYVDEALPHRYRADIEAARAVLRDLDKRTHSSE